mmetsp:Transcript_11866/g.43383  ORF Transcript_11866/g.43383 Transcript_11866/m.43383 type:complete len:692 (-) Transcript_11866:1105-3180(-)
MPGKLASAGVTSTQTEQLALNFFMDSSNDVFAVYGKRLPARMAGSERAPAGSQGKEYEPYYLYLNTVGVKSLGQADLQSVVNKSNFELLGEVGKEVDGVVLSCFEKRKRLSILHDVSGRKYDTVYNYVQINEGKSGSRWAFGVLRSVLGRMEPSSDENSEFVFAVCRDVTKRFLAEEENKQLKLKAEQAVESMANMVVRMSHDLRTSLVGVLSPAEVLLGSDGLDGEQTRMVQIIKNSTKLLLTLCNDITDITRIEQGQIVSKQRVFHLVELCSGCVELLHHQFVSAGVELEFEYDVGPVPLWVRQDPERIKQIVVNLLYNAIKFTPNGGSVRFSLGCHHIAQSGSGTKDALEVAGQATARQYRSRDSIQSSKRLRTGIDEEQPGDSARSSPDPHAHDNMMLEFNFRDSGIGIPKDSWESIFRPFSQVDSSAYTRKDTDFSMPKPETRGTGLGLSICRGLSEVLGGSLELVHSEINKGSHFRLRVPCATADPAASAPTAPAAAQYASSIHAPSNTRADARENPQVWSHSLAVPQDQETAEAAPKTQQEFSNLNVLLVDDHPISLMVVRKLAESLGCCKISLASNGYDAVERVGNSDFDLVLMDMNMPGMDGMTAVRKIRSDLGDRKRAQPFIAMATAAGMSGDRERCFRRCDIDEYIVKPVLKDELKNVLSLAQNREARGATLPTASNADV